MITLADSLIPSPQQWVILAGLAVVAVLLMGLRKKNDPPNSRPRQPRSEKNPADPQASEVRDDLDRLLAELETLSRKMNEQLEERYNLVQDAIRDADQRISALRVIVSAVREAASPSAESRLPNPVTYDAPDERSRSIYDLADLGLTASQIAQRLEEPLGEVELILNLRQ